MRNILADLKIPFTHYAKKYQVNYIYKKQNYSLLIWSDNKRNIKKIIKNYNKTNKDKIKKVKII